MTVADCIVTQVIVRFGCPHQLHSDQGRDWESKLFQDICRLLGIQKTRTTPYNPQSDGLVERFNRTLIEMLAKLVNERRSDWDDILPYVLCAYRATPHRSTGLSPNRLMLGREALLPVDLVYGYAVPDQRQCPIEYVEWVRAAMEESFERCRRDLHEAALRQARHYNRISGDPAYKEGQWVLLFYPPVANLKLGLKFLGPYQVKRRITEVTYEIQSPVTLKCKVVHVNHLKPYLSEVMPDDIPRLPDVPQSEDLDEYFLQPLIPVVDPGCQEGQGLPVDQTEGPEDDDIIPAIIRSSMRPRRTRKVPDRYGYHVGF